MSPQYYPSGLKKFLEQELRQKCDAVFGEGMTAVSVVADWGRPDSHLIELAGDARMDVIVMGTSQRRGLGRLGSVSRAVVHYAHLNVACVPVPLAVTPPAGGPKFERVLVPLDFSESDAKAVALAFASVRPGGEVRLVHVMPEVRRNGHSPRRAACQVESSQELSTRMEALVPKAARRDGIRTRAEVVEHHEPALAICQIADQFDADLICLAARKRPWLHETLFGSVSQRVMVCSRRPVLITRSPGHKHSDQPLVETLT
jgi:nucleotide-binding universal stress UspA family protein